MYRFVKSRVAPATWILLVASAALAVLATPLHYTLPWAGGGWQPQLFAPLTPALFVMFCGFTMGNWMSVLERSAARVVWARLGWAAAVIGISTAVGAFAGWLNAPAWTGAMARNGAGFAGLMLLSAVLLGSRLAWIPPLALLLAVLLGGRDVETASALAWALPLAPATSVPALACTVVIVSLGLFSYARWDSRPSRGIVGE